MKKLLSLGLAATMVLPVAAVGTVGASAAGSVGGFGTLGTYTPSAGVKTNRLLFAMPGAWQNSVTEDPRCGGSGSRCSQPVGDRRPDLRQRRKRRRYPDHLEQLSRRRTRDRPCQEPFLCSFAADQRFSLSVL